MHGSQARSARSVIPIVLLMVAALGSPLAAQETQDTMALPEALRSARASLSDAFTRLDAAAAAALFTETGSVEMQGETLSGRQSIAGWFGDVFSTIDSLRNSTSGFMVAETEVVERGGYTVQGMEGGQSGRVETIWRLQEDGSWKVARLVVM